MGSRNETFNGYNQYGSYRGTLTPSTIATIDVTDTDPLRNSDSHAASVQIVNRGPDSIYAVCGISDTADDVVDPTVAGTGDTTNQMIHIALDEVANIGVVTRTVKLISTGASVYEILVVR